MSDDLIKRSDAIKAVEECLKLLARPRYTVKTAIEAIPSVDIPHSDDWEKYSDRLWKNAYERGKADRPQGEWILLEPRYPIEQKVYWNKEQALADTKGNGARERRKCSCCGYTKSFMCYMKDEQIKLWKFCPNCGAKLKGADDE